MRSISFANAFLFSAVHIWGKGYSPGFWALLAGTFLIYPQMAHWRACRAPDTQRAELQNLRFDCFLVAIPIAMMGFPLWITFTLFIATTINNSIARGQRGTIPAVINFALGSWVGGLFTGFRVSLEHSGWITVLCILGLCWDLFGIGHVAFKRALKLRQIRAELTRGEVALQHVNRDLQERLNQIDALQGLLKEQANRDPLTGLYNRRYLQETMERELARCQREQIPLCVILIDLDLFKNVNDQHGHHVGDEVIKEIARLLIAEARQEDVACRYGGEEFMLLMARMPMDVARERAEDWRQRFGATEVPAGETSVRTTLSVGIAEFPTHGRTAEALIQRADVALYQAKLGGRDRVICYAPPPTDSSSITTAS
ncbi:MAG: diguanylate cyclase [Vicinamibacteria bacterium]